LNTCLIAKANAGASSCKNKSKMILRVFRCIIFSATLLVLHGKVRGQGPIDGYLKGKGMLDIALSYTYSSSNKYFGADNKQFDLEYESHTAGLFTEYGISDKVDAVLTLPFVITDEEKNFQDLGLFIKYRPLYVQVKEKNKLGIILSTGYSFPVSNYQPDVTGALGQRAQVIPLKAVAQFEFEKGTFINFTGAYHLRVDRLSDATIEEAQAANPLFQPSRPGNFMTLMLKGGLAAQYYYFDLYAEYQKTFDGVDFEDSIVKPSQLYAVDYLKLGAGFYYSIDSHTGFALNAAYIPAGKNIGNIFSFSASPIMKIQTNKKRKPKL